MKISVDTKMIPHETMALIAFSLARTFKHNADFLDAGCPAGVGADIADWDAFSPLAREQNAAIHGELMEVVEDVLNRLKKPELYRGDLSDLKPIQDAMLSLDEANLRNVKKVAEAIFKAAEGIPEAHPWNV